MHGPGVGNHAALDSNHPICDRQYVLQMRVHRAKELLRPQHVSIKAVAVRPNYENQYCSLRIFRKKAGMSRLEWKRSAALSNTNRSSL